MWDIGDVEYWGMENWNVGILGMWKIGGMENWNVGILEDDVLGKEKKTATDLRKMATVIKPQKTNVNHNPIIK